MGKIRVKTLGDEQTEKNEKNDAKKRQVVKKLAKAPGAKGGERVVAVGPSEEELAALDIKEEAKEIAEEPKKEEKKKYSDKNKKTSPHSKKYNSLLDDLDRNKPYGLQEALSLLEKLQRKSFDETVELHINTLSQGISGNVTLPHGTGKKTRVVIADDKVIAEVEKGIINFDILVAEPSMMASLAKVAKVLGPRGLMPNPKNGTISSNPQDMVKKYEVGLINFKTETKAPIIHLTVGKMSFGAEKLSQNIDTLISAIKKQNISSVTLKSTMSPGIKVKV